MKYDIVLWNVNLKFFLLQEEDARQKATVIPVHVEKTENSSRMQNWESSNTSSTASAEATSVQGKSLEVDQEECECARCSLENRCQAKNTQIALSNASHSRTEEGVSASKQSSSVYTKSSQNEGAEIGSYGSWDTFLPITRRGNFFKDSFFSDIHQDFNSAIKEVLERWNDTDLRLRDRWDGADFLDHYRQLRSRDLKEENQAVTVASGNSSYKVRLIFTNQFSNGWSISDDMDITTWTVGTDEVLIITTFVTDCVGCPWLHGWRCEGEGGGREGVVSGRTCGKEGRGKLIPVVLFLPTTLHSATAHWHDSHHICHVFRRYPDDHCSCKGKIFV